jgi:hypothetical protein
MMHASSPSGYTIRRVVADTAIEHVWLCCFNEPVWRAYFAAAQQEPA